VTVTLSSQGVVVTEVKAASGFKVQGNPTPNTVPRSDVKVTFVGIAVRSKAVSKVTIERDGTFECEDENIGSSSDEDASSDTSVPTSESDD